MANEVRIATDVDALFERMTDDVVAIVDDEVRAGRDRVLERARTAWPVGETGESRDGLRAIDPYGIDNDAPYAVYVHRAGSSQPVVDELITVPLAEELNGPILDAIAERIGGV